MGDVRGPLKEALPKLVRSQRLVVLIPLVRIALLAYLPPRQGPTRDMAFIDATSAVGLSSSSGGQ